MIFWSWEDVEWENCKGSHRIPFIMLTIECVTNEIHQFYRLLVGSTSKYCVENAKCNVLTIKNDWNPTDFHSNLSDVIKAEETEKNRKLEEYHDMHQEHPVESLKMHSEKKD